MWPKQFSFTFFYVFSLLLEWKLPYIFSRTGHNRLHTYTLTHSRPCTTADTGTYAWKRQCSMYCGSSVGKACGSETEKKAKIEMAECFCDLLGEYRSVSLAFKRPSNLSCTHQSTAYSCFYFSLFMLLYLCHYLKQERYKRCCKPMNDQGRRRSENE